MATDMQMKGSDVLATPTAQPERQWNEVSLEHLLSTAVKEHVPK